MAEALVCGTGTPVRALRKGSSPEVLEHAVTGFICDTGDELVAAVSHIEQAVPGRGRAALFGSGNG